MVFDRVLAARHGLSIGQQSIIGRDFTIVGLPEGTTA
jgi:hypothetical protein